jgi:hypothetical protein
MSHIPFGNVSPLAVSINVPSISQNKTLYFFHFSFLYLFKSLSSHRTILCFLQNLIEYLTAFRISSYSFVLYTLYVRSFRIISSSMKGSISFSKPTHFLCVLRFLFLFLRFAICLFVHLSSFRRYFLILGTSHGSKRRNITIWIINLITSIFIPRNFILHILPLFLFKAYIN